MTAAVLVPAAPADLPPATSAHPVPAPPLAPFWARALAALVDALALFGLQVQAYALGVLVGRDDAAVQLGVQLVGLLLVTVVAVAQLVRQGRTGSTWGKQLVGLQVRDAASGDVVGTRRSLLRALAHLLDNVTLVGYLLPLVQRRRQTLADLVVGTVVVRTGRTPRERRRPGRALLGVVAAGQVLTLMSAAGTADLDVEERAAEPAAVARDLQESAPAAPAAPAAPTRRALAADDLEGRIMAVVEGFTQVPDDEFDLGRLDAAAAGALGGATGSEAEAAAAGLRLLGYRDGLGHAYGGDSALYTVLVYRFADSEGAKALVDSARTDAPGTFRSRTVPAALTYEEPMTSGFYNQIALFADREYVYEVDVLTRQPDADHALFDQLLQRQRTHVQTT